MNAKWLSGFKSRLVAASLCGVLVGGIGVGSAHAQGRPPVRTTTPPSAPARPASATTTPAVRSSSPTSVTAPVRQAAASEVTANRNATARPVAPPTPRLHGNSASSNRPTTVYGIYETKRATGETRLHKVGISGTEPKMSVQRQVSPRAENQVRSKTRTATDTAYRSRVLEKIPSQPPGQPTARQKALQLEREIVTKHAIKRGTGPVDNIFPKPTPFSPWPRRK